MAQYRYIEYKESVDSLVVDLMYQATFNKAGIYSGFDISLNANSLTINHSTTGRTILLPDGTSQSNSGVALTKQGIVIIDDTTYTPAIDTNTSTTLARWDILVLNHQHVNITGGSSATFDIIKGDLALEPVKPDSLLTIYQVPLAYIYIPANTTNLATDSGVLIQTLRNDKKDFKIAAKDSDPTSIAKADIICNGIADEVKINAAINLISTLTDSQIAGGSITFLAGTYYIENSIVLKDNISLIGESSVSIYSDSNASAITMFTGSINNVKIENIKAGAYSSGNSASVLYSGTLTDSKIYNIKSDLPINIGLVNTTIDKVNISGLFTINTTSSNFVISNSVLTRVLSTSIITDAIIKDNTLGRNITGNRYNIELTSTSNKGIRIISNYVRDDITLKGSRCLISSNIVDGVDADNGIVITDLSNSTVIGNSFATNIASQIIPSTGVNNNIYDIAVATTTTKGKVELATSTEVSTGTDTERVVTPATLKATYSVKSKVFEVTGWDMSSSLSVSVDISPISTENIRGLDAIIINDSGNTSTPLGIYDGTTFGGGFTVGGTDIVALVRTTGGLYDDTTYSSTVALRGYLTVWYV